MGKWLSNEPNGPVASIALLLSPFTAFMAINTAAGGYLGLAIGFGLTGIGLAITAWRFFWPRRRPPA